MPTPFGRNIAAAAIADLPDAVLELPGTVHRLHAEVHGVDDQQILAVQTQLRRIVKFARGIAVLADGVQHIAIHIQNVNLVAQRIGDVDPLLFGIDGNSGGPLEKSFAALQAAYGVLILSIGIEDENLAGFRIADVNIVLAIYGNTLWCQHRVLVLVLTLNELVFLLHGIEDVDALRSRIGNDDAAARVLHHTVGTHQEVNIGLAYYKVEDANEELRLGTHVAIGGEAALKAKFPAALQQKFRDLDLRSLGFLRRTPKRRHCKHHY